MRKFNIKKFLLFIFCLLLIIVLMIYFGYKFMISSPSKNGKEIDFYVEEGSTYSTIAKELKDNNLIKNELAYKIYLKLNKPTKSLEYGNYILKTNYSVKELLDTFARGTVTRAQTVRITFPEGKNIRQYVKLINEKLNISTDLIFEKLSDNDYLDTLIKDYWFLTDDIKNKDIYYSLEGYLFPDTYDYFSTSDIDTVLRKMLDNTESKLSDYQSAIEKSEYSIHQIMTMASIIEQEAGGSDDRNGISGVIYNRLKDNWSLGIDATTYYAEKIDGFERDLKKSELEKCNAYNTRSSCLTGKLPVGPICNAGIKSLDAAVNPENHKYYYYVADKTGKTYFTKTYGEHNKKCNELKKAGLWIEYN